MSDLDRRLTDLFADQAGPEINAEFADRVVARLPLHPSRWWSSPRGVLAAYWIVASVLAAWAVASIGWSLMTMVVIAGAAIMVLLPLALVLRSAGVAISDLFLGTVRSR